MPLFLVKRHNRAISWCLEETQPILSATPPGRAQQILTSATSSRFAVALKSVWGLHGDGLDTELKAKLRVLDVNPTLPRFESAWPTDLFWVSVPVTPVPAKTEVVLPRPGQIKENSPDGLKYAYIPSGEFFMGCHVEDRDCGKEEWPRHAVRITEPFWLGTTEVTVGAFRRYTRQNKEQMPSRKR